MSVVSMFVSASWFVQLVVLLLLVLSIGCWALIIGKSQRLNRTTKLNKNFETQFWSGVNLNDLYQSCLRKIRNNNADSIAPNEHTFVAAMGEYQKLTKLVNKQDIAAVISSLQRSMYICSQQEIEKLENGLTYLSSVASTAPYIGLLGTVWGIMHAFTGLSVISEVTVATVAPGIAEALVATAIGLITAIPAVLAYNHFVRKNERIILQIESFNEDFINVMQRNLSVKEDD